MKKIGMTAQLCILFFSCEKNDNIPAQNVNENSHLRANVETQEKKIVTKNLTYISKGMQNYQKMKILKLYYTLK